MRSALLTLAALFLWSAHASADEPKRSRSAWEERPFAVQLAGSLWGSPSGLIGLGGDYAIVPWFSVSASVGAGGIIYHDPHKSSPTPLIAASGRFRALLDDENAFTAAAGLSMGPYAQGTYCVDCEPNGDKVWVWNWAYWADFSIGLEARTKMRPGSNAAFAFQVNVGLEYLLNAHNDACFQSSAGYGGTDHDPCIHPSEIHHVFFPFVQMTAGLAF